MQTQFTNCNHSELCIRILQRNIYVIVNFVGLASNLQTLVGVSAAVLSLQAVWRRNSFLLRGLQSFLLMLSNKLCEVHPHYGG